MLTSCSQEPFWNTNRRWKSPDVRPGTNVYVHKFMEGGSMQSSEPEALLPISEWVRKLLY